MLRHLAQALVRASLPCRISLLAAASSVALLTGCSDDAATASLTGAEAGRGQGALSPPPRPGGASPEELVLDSARLAVSPGDTVQLSVQARPAGRYDLQLSLVGPSGDASLDRGSLTTAEDGTAAFQLTAPTSTQGLVEGRLSVSVGGGTTRDQLDLYVTDRGTAVVVVEPDYQGRRPVEQWTASVRTGARCAELTPLGDGDLVVSSASSPKLASLPPGKPLAVLVRAGQYVAGCSDTGALSPEEVRTLRVRVQDVPLRLGGLNLRVTLEPDEPAAIEARLEPVRQALVDTFAADTASDASRLLSAMEELASSPEAFAASRQAARWDATLEADLGGPEALRDEVASWLDAGVKALARSGLTGRLAPGVSGGGGDGFELRVDTVGDVPVAGTGFTQVAPVSLSTEANDVLLLGMELPWVPTRALSALADPPARERVIGSGGSVEALSQLTGCSTLAARLGSDTQLYPGCDASCAAKLCEEALHAIWEQVGAAKGDRDALLRLSATAVASVDDAAVPVGFVGSWLGSLGLPALYPRPAGVQENLSGSAVATANDDGDPSDGQ